MFRERLKKVTGCLRCRKRRTKCDEKRPRCSYCQKWDLSCPWPPLRKQPDESAVNMRPIDASDSETVQHRHPIQTLIHQPANDCFDYLPITNIAGYFKVKSVCEFLCFRMIPSCLPFDFVDIDRTTFENFVETSMSDEVACCSLVAYGATVQHKFTNEMALSNLALTSESRMMTLLRQRIESGTYLTETTIMAAAIHFVKVLIDSNPIDIRKICAGIYAMVRSRGGFEILTHNFRMTTLCSLWSCDAFISLLDAVNPVFTLTSEPKYPISLGDMYKENDFDDRLCQYINPEILGALQKIRLLLFFRRPSKQARAFDKEEYLYMVEIFSFLDIQLGELQARHLNQRSLAEVLIITGLLIKCDIIGGTMQHPILIKCIRRRLSEAISTEGFNVSPIHQIVKLWACFIASTGTGSESDTNPFLSTALSLLSGIYGVQSWPLKWRDEIHAGFERIIWNSRLDTTFSNVCDVVETMR